MLEYEKMNSGSVLISICAIFSVILVSSAQQKPYTGTYVPKIIQSNGYPIEVHEVFTEDGYIIELHRIPYGIHNSSRSDGRSRKAIVLGHCIFCSSSVYVVLGRKALAYTLADDGYDVWLINSRGTKTSKKHIKYSSTDEDYWKFSWSEQGIYDNSAVIDYTLKVTRQPQVDYLAFSMGNAQLFSLLSERSEYNSKIRTVISLAPAVFMNSSAGFFPIPPFISDRYLKEGVESGDLQFPTTSISNEIKQLLAGSCNPVLRPLFKGICNLVYQTIGGNLNGNVDNDSLYYYFKFFPDTISRRGMIHYTQLRYSGKFLKYNFGRRKNKKIYGSPYPPKFNLDNVRVPINLFYSRSDTVTDSNDIERLSTVLPNVVYKYVVPFREFSHMDFAWGKNAPEQVYTKVLERLKMDY